jgi:hypothetical protein
MERSKIPAYFSPKLPLGQKFSKIRNNHKWISSRMASCFVDRVWWTPAYTPQDSRCQERAPGLCDLCLKTLSFHTSAQKLHNHHFGQEGDPHQAQMAHPCNPDYSGGRDRRIVVQNQPGHSSQEPILKIPNPKKSWQSGSSGRVAAQQAWRPKFKSQCHQKIRAEAILGRTRPSPFAVPRQGQIDWKPTHNLNHPHWQLQKSEHSLFHLQWDVLKLGTFWFLSFLILK